MIAAAAKYFGENYDSFSFDNGEYFLGSLDLSESMTLKRIFVEIEDGSLKSLKCAMIEAGDATEKNVTVSDIGTTKLGFTAIPDDPTGYTFVITHAYNSAFQDREGKTLTFTKEGTLKGTFDFGNGPCDDLTGANVITYTFDEELSSIYVNTNPEIFIDYRGDKGTFLLLIEDYDNSQSGMFDCELQAE